MFVSFRIYLSTPTCTTCGTTVLTTRPQPVTPWAHPSSCNTSVFTTVETLHPLLHPPRKFHLDRLRYRALLLSCPCQTPGHGVREDNRSTRTPVGTHRFLSRSERGTSGSLPPPGESCLGVVGAGDWSDSDHDYSPPPVTPSPNNCRDGHRFRVGRTLGVRRLDSLGRREISVCGFEGLRQGDSLPLFWILVVDGTTRPGGGGHRPSPRTRGLRPPPPQNSGLWTTTIELGWWAGLSLTV